MTVSTWVNDDVNCDVEFDYTPGAPAVMYLPNGDPGYPAESPEMHIHKVMVDGVDIFDTIEPEEMEKLEQRVWDIIEDL